MPKTKNRERKAAKQVEKEAGKRRMKKARKHLLKQLQRFGAHVRSASSAACFRSRRAPADDQGSQVVDQGDTERQELVENIKGEYERPLCAELLKTPARRSERVEPSADQPPTAIVAAIHLTRVEKICVECIGVDYMGPNCVRDGTTFMPLIHLEGEESLMYDELVLGMDKFETREDAYRALTEKLKAELSKKLVERANAGLVANKAALDKIKPRGGDEEDERERADDAENETSDSETSDSEASV